MIARASQKPPSDQLAFEVGSPAADVERLRELVRANAANKPGVYRVIGVHGDVLYVGKSTKVRTRLLSYFRLPWPEHRHARMLREAASIEWEYQPSEFAALLREVRLIRAHLPRYNVRSARPLDRWFVITVTEGPAPRLLVQRASAAARRRGHGGPIIGPFASRRPLMDALRVLNDALGLRDCSERIPLILRDAGDLFDEFQYPSLLRTPGCHRYETERCLGPCVAACSESEYRTQLTRARAVLEGRDDSPQQELMREMTIASAALSYERAGWLRNRLTALQGLEAQLAHVREALERPSFIYPVFGENGDHRLYLVRDGRVVLDARITDEDALDRFEQTAMRPMTTAAFGAVADQLDELLMVEQWFRTRPDERERTTSNVGDALALFRRAGATRYSSGMSSTSACLLSKM